MAPQIAYTTQSIIPTMNPLWCDVLWPEGAVDVIGGGGSSGAGGNKGGGGGWYSPGAIDKTTNSLCEVSRIFLIFLRFYLNFHPMLKPLIASTTLPCHLVSTSCLPRTASCWVKGPHHLEPPGQPFHKTHKVLQRVQLASEIPPALPFDCIQHHRTRVDLDCHTSSTAQAPATSGLYLEHHRHQGCSNLVQFGASDAPRHDFILKFSYFHFKLTSQRITTLYHVSRLAVIVLR
jgi:hypothetical protein